MQANFFDTHQVVFFVNQAVEMCMNDFPLSTSVLKTFVKEKRSAKRSSRPSMPENFLPIVGFAREHGRITIGEAIRLTGGNRNTLKGHFRNW